MKLQEYIYEELSTNLTFNSSYSIYSIKGLQICGRYRVPAGETRANISVAALPPNESCSSRVTLLSR